MHSKFFSLSDGSFTIKDVRRDRGMFSCKGKFLSMSDKRTMYGPDGETPVFVIKEPLMQMDNKQEIYSVEGTGKQAKPKDLLFKVASNMMNTKQYTIDLNKQGVPAELNG